MCVCMCVCVCVCVCVRGVHFFWTYAIAYAQSCQITTIILLCQPASAMKKLNEAGFPDCSVSQSYG
jgi:hypothetical protein